MKKSIKGINFNFKCIIKKSDKIEIKSNSNNYNLKLIISNYNSDSKFTNLNITENEENNLAISFSCFIKYLSSFKYISYKQLPNFLEFRGSESNNGSSYKVKLKIPKDSFIYQEWDCAKNPLSKFSS